LTNSFDEHQLEKLIAEITKITNNDVSVIEAICHYSETSGMEIETVAELIKKSIPMVSQIRETAEGLNLLEKTPTLF
jgi:hypothetical protein